MSRTSQNSAWIVAVIFFLAFTLTCSSNKDPVGELLAELEAAAEARDAKAFEKRMASGFSGNGGISRAEALDLLRRYFVAYERINLDVTNVERSKADDRVSFHVFFSGQANTEFNLQNLLPATAAYDFELRLVQEEGMLKVNQASWRETPE